MKTQLEDKMYQLCKIGLVGENADYIVKCVNMHEAIVTKLVTSLSALTSLDKENQFEDLRENIERLIEKAK